MKAGELIPLKTNYTKNTMLCQFFLSPHRLPLGNFERETDGV